MKNCKEKYRLMYEASPDAIMLLDEHGFLDCNPATLVMFACATSKEFLGRHPSEYSPPTQLDGRDSRKAADDKIATAYKNGSNLFEWTHRRANGEVFPAEVQLTLLKLNDKKILQASVREVTKRKQIEERLQSIVRLSTRSSGDDFFRILVSSVADALGVKVAFVAKLDSTEPISADSLAIWIDGDPAENMQWSLSGTPCEEVAKGKPVFIAEGVQTAFPDDQWLSEVGLESYLGLPMIDNDGHVIGHVGVMDDKPLQNQQEIENILNIFTDRAATELERKQTQEALVTSEKNFRQLVEADCYALVVHKDFKIIYGNALAHEIFEVSDRDSALGQSILDYIHPRYQNFARMGIQRMIRRNSSISPIQVKGVTAKGRGIDLDFRSMPICFDNSPAVMSVIYDITDSKRTEYFLNQTSKIFKKAASGSAAEEVYNLICRMYEEIYPEMRTSILRLKGNQLFHCSAPSLPEEYCKAIDGIEVGSSVGSCGTAAFFGKGVIVEEIATDPLWTDFKEVALPYNLRACWSEPVMGDNERVLGTFAMYFDHPASPDDDQIEMIRGAADLVAIMMQRELREATLNKLSQAIEQAGESIMITDKEGIIEYVNPAFTKLTGYAAEEAIGQTPRLLKSGNQDTAFYERLWETITHGDVWQGKVIDRKKDGSFYPVILVIAPIIDDAGLITHFVGTHTDVSELEDMEHRFHQAQKMEAIGTLVGGIAHDFNNMLAGMTGNLYLAKKNVQDNPDVLQKLANVEKLSFRAADMIEQLLTFARKGMVNMKPIPLNPYIKETLKLFCTAIPEDITLRHHICKDTLLIKGDTSQIHQVLMNLVNNARDAVEDVDDPSIHIRLDAFVPDDGFIETHPYFKAVSYARLRVEDNGCGIPEHQLEHLFEPFFTTKEQGKGTGLGLAMVFGAIKTHHGYVEVESVEGEGSTFHIYLPLLEKEETASTSLEDEGLVEGSGETILLVDDEANILETGGEVLESLGYRALTASNGLEAVEVFTANSDKISLIIIDVVMPKLGGIKAVERIRKISPDIKVIFATGYDKNTSLPDAIDTNKAVILSKPYNIEVLSKAIRKQLDS